MKLQTVSEWKDIEGYNGVYAVNQFGAVKSLLGRHGVTYKPSILRLRLTGRNRNRVQYVLSDLCGKTINKLASRLVAEAFIPNPENKPQVHHIDNNPLNNHVSNLKWVTNSENQLHSMEHGTFCWENLNVCR